MRNHHNIFIPNKHILMTENKTKKSFLFPCIIHSEVKIFYIFLKTNKVRSHNNSNPKRPFLKNRNGSRKK